MKKFRNKTIKKILLGALLVSTLCTLNSCKKEIAGVSSAESYTGNNYSDIFDAFWNGMNNNYLFWSIDTTDWDRVYKQYKPLFANLNYYSNSDNYKALLYFEEMTAGLIDSHYDLTFEQFYSTSGSNYSFSPAAYRYRYNLDTGKTYHSQLPDSLYYSLIPRRYLDPGSIHYGHDTIASSYDISAISGTIGSQILYLHFNNFYLQLAYLTQSSTVRNVLSYYFNEIGNLPSSIKGIVIDLRGNTGGNVTDLDFLLGRMITSNLTFGATRYKNGNGRLDYTPWINALVRPQTGAVNISLPIVVLADNYSASMSEITTIAIKALSNGKFIGEKTWGATGPLTSNVYYNSGQFTAANFLNVYTSSSMFRDKNGKIYEGSGITPDIKVADNQTLLSIPTGSDAQLDRAVSYIKNGN